MNKKGFTLIELLAVIIILGALAVIITPRITNTLKEAEQKTNMTSAQNLIKAAEYKIADEEITGVNENIVIDYGNNTNTNYLDYTGATPEEGIVKIKKNGKVAMAVKIGDSCYLKSFNSNDITTEPFDEETCNSESEVFKNAVELPPGTVQEDGAKYLTNAVEVYYNPTTGEKCSSSDSVSTTGTTTGCLHWYLYSVKGDYANMLLDHNITEGGAANGLWAYSDTYNDTSATSAGITYPGIETIPEYGTGAGQSWNARGPVTALNTLKSLTSGWNGTQTPKVPNSSSTNEYIITKDKNNNKYQIDYTGYKARLITYEETVYLGCTTSSSHPSLGWMSISCPEWMSEGTNGIRIYGYWTSSQYADNSISAWCAGIDIGASGAAGNAYYGVRPVITVLVDDVFDD